MEITREDVRNIVESLMKVNKLHLVDDSESSALYLRIAMQKILRTRLRM